MEVEGDPFRSRLGTLKKKLITKGTMSRRLSKLKMEKLSL
jgi:hypothetical protein